MNRRCGSSKPTPTPLNGLVMKPGKTRRKVIEGNAVTIIRQITLQKPAAYRQCGGGARRKRRYGKTDHRTRRCGKTNLRNSRYDKTNHRKSRYGKTNHRQNLPAYRQRGGGGETKKGELRRTQALRQRKPTSKPSRRLPSWWGGRDKTRKPTRNAKVAQPTVPREEGSA